MNDLKLSEFVKIYDNVLPPSVCSSLITNFEQQTDHHVMSGVGKNEEVTTNGYRRAVEMNCSVVADNNEDWKNLTNKLNGVVMSYLNRYRYDMRVLGVADFAIPDTKILEEWRMHKYNQGEHFYKSHVDSHDSNSSNRMLAFLFYPNTIEDGGETAFTDNLKGLECKPVQGRLLVFPTWFGFPHEAKTVTEGTKYMLKTYAHYPGELEIG